MVAKITVPVTINRALNYNEQKVEKGLAKCIHENGFLKEVKEANTKFILKLLKIFLKKSL